MRTAAGAEALRKRLRLPELPLLLLLLLVVLVVVLLLLVGAAAAPAAALAAAPTSAPAAASAARNPLGNEDTTRDRGTPKAPTICLHALPEPITSPMERSEAF